MNVNGILPVQNVYKYNTVGVTGAAETFSVKASSDMVEISPEAARQSKISSFLKDKPYSSYKYGWMMRNQPDKADEYIDNLMTTYDEKTCPDLIPPYHPKDRDIYAKYVLGYKTADDVQEGMEKGNFVHKVFEMMGYMRRLEETEETLKADDKDWYIGGNVPPARYGKFFNDYGGDYSYYRDMKIDPETAEVYFLPNDSDEWVSKEDFEKISPDYKAGIDYYAEFRLAARAGQDTCIKYIENFISNLSDEEKDWIKNSNMFGSPAFRNLGIEGLDYFETSYDNIEGVRKRVRMKDSDWIEQLQANSPMHINLDGQGDRILTNSSIDLLYKRMAGVSGVELTEEQMHKTTRSYGYELTWVDPAVESCILVPDDLSGKTLQEAARIIKPA